MSLDNWLNQDYESEYDKDYIFALERQKDIEASWEMEENKKPITFIYEDIPRNKSFRRFSKRIFLLRKELLISSYSKNDYDEYFRRRKGEEEILPQSLQEKE